MSQEEVLQILEKVRKHMSWNEISLELKAETTTERFKVSRALSKLIKHNEIKFMEISRFEARERFGENAPLRRLRLYYVD